MSSTVAPPRVLNNYIFGKSAAYLSGYSLQYLRRMMRNSQLIGIKIGQVWLIDKQSLDTHLLLQRVSDRRYGPK